MYEKHRLSNGVRVVAERIPYAYSAVIGIWVRTGSRFEQEGNRGVSHFIEHLFFKGTTNRNAKQIAEELEALGGALNAFTAKEYTCFYAKVLAEHLPVAMDLLSDMFFNSLFAEADIEKERNVILEEIKMYEDTPDELIHDLFAANVWQTHPLGYPILGSAESVSAIDRKAILDYYHQRYTPENVVISIAGNIDYQQVFSSLEKIFGHWSSDSKNKNRQEPPVPRSGEVYYHKDTEQVHLCLGTPSISQEDERIYAMIVLNSIIGGGLSSRLFQEIREERGLVYSIYSYHSSYIDAGLFSIYAGTGINNTKEVVRLVLKELSQIRDKGITEDELVRVREQIKGSILLSMESISNRMSRLGRSEVCYNRVITSDEIVAGVSKVSLQEIQLLAKTLFQKGNLSLTAIGPKGLALDLPQLMTETM
ncbi:MAG: insulinase family protein [Clostridia bacterium]|jgi:predicted Zn-dependent peptidase|nr:insulinase family protein [Clostridia bacterium]